MNFHDPEIAIPGMALGALIMVFALVRYHVLTRTIPASDFRKFSLVFGLGWLLTLAAGFAAFSH